MLTLILHVSHLLHLGQLAQPSSFAILLKCCFFASAVNFSVFLSRQLEVEQKPSSSYEQHCFSLLAFGEAVEATGRILHFERANLDWIWPES